MKRNIQLVFLITMFGAISSCGQVDFKKTRTGLMYKIFDKGSRKDSLARIDNVVKLNYTQKLNDSLLQSSYGKMPIFVKISTPDQVNYSPLEVLPLMRKGDSAVTVQMIDTLLKQGLAQQLPPTAKKGDRLTTTLRILQVFTSDSLARLDYDAEMKKDEPRRMKEMQEQREKQEKEMVQKKEEEAKFIEDYLASKNIKTVKSPKGVYVQVINEGTGAKADSGKFVAVMYRGSTFKGKVFDTNMDTSFHHTDPITFTIGRREMVDGFEEGIKYLREGGQAIIYVPGVLAYGPQSRPPDIGPYENLIFELRLVSVKDGPPGPK
jgi:FKBP-type peptidyl-prolyl cis-trans isomerase FkpA